MAIIFPITPENHYWVVGGSTTQVYSSAIGDYVPVNNASYQAWLAPGRLPTKMADEADLGQLLAKHQLRPVAAGVLDAYKDAHADNIVAAVIFKILFNHENRLRTIERNLGLNGSPPNLTPAQAKNAVKALM